MRRLIINADDFGADEARNAGIEEAVHAGVVTGISILPNGPALKDGLQRILSWTQRNLSVGVHLNLSEGKPLTQGLKALTDRKGSFLGKINAHHLLMEHRDSTLKEAISQELSLQIESILDQGLSIDHLDGHQHVHIFPAVFPVLINKVVKYRIPWIRVPAEPSPLPPSDAIPAFLRREASFFTRVAKKAKAKLRDRPVRTADHFRGLYLTTRLTLTALTDVLREIPSGLTELMVHPGRVPGRSLSNPFSLFSTEDREKELNVLLDPKLRGWLRDQSICLTPFPN